MDLLFNMSVPLIIAFVALYGIWRRVDVYDAVMHGAGDGLGVLLKIVPALIGLLTAVYMLRASGALELAAQALGPLLTRLGIPPRDGGAAAGAASVRLGGIGGGGRAYLHLRSRQHRRPYGGGDAGLHRDHLLHHRRLLRGGGHRPDPLRRPGRPVRRSGGLYGRRLRRTALLWIKNGRGCFRVRFGFNRLMP